MIPFLDNERTPQPPGTPDAVVTPRAEVQEPGGIYIGDTVYGDFDQGASEVWMLTLLESATIDIDLIADGDAWDPILEIRGADGAVIMVDDDGGDGYNSRLSRLALDAGAYEVHVQAFSGDGLYTLSVQQSEDVLHIEYGDTLLGEIQAGDEDWWHFEGEAGDSVVISMTGLGDFDDTYLELYDAERNWLTSDDDGGDGFSARISGYILPETGEYYIAASGFGSNYGQYELALDSVEAEELIISYGEMLYGELTESVRQQFWSFEGEAGDEISISMEGLGLFNDTVLELYGPNGERLTYDDDSGQGLFALISGFFLPETGSYRILARAYGSDIGEYTLTLTRGSGGETGEVEERPIAYGETVYGEITDAFPEQYWIFEGEAGDTISISMEGLGAFADTYLELYSSDGEILASNDDGGEGLFALISGFALPETGSYRILARAYSRDTGDYALTLDTVEIVEEVIAYGETRSGELTPAQPRAYWSFEGNAGDIVSISMVGSAGLGDTYLELYAPDGRLLIEDDDSGAGLFALISSFVLGESGTYRIVARAYGSGVGGYELTLTQMKENVIAYGQTLRGVLTDGTPQEWWLFEGEAGQLVSISMVGLGDLDDTCLELRDLDGTLLSFDDESGKGDFARIEGYVLPVTGTYRIVAGAYCSVYEVLPYDDEPLPELPVDGLFGPYQLSLRQVEVGDIAYGQTVNGSLTEEALVGYWRFDGVAGEVVDISMVGVGELDPYVELHAPDGTLLIEDDDGGEGYAALIEEYILPQTGSYRIAARSFDGQPGAYRLIVRRAAVTEQPLVYGDVVTAALTLADPVGYFRFDGEEGDEVVVSMVGLDDFTDTILELYGPGGDLAAYDDDSGDGYFALVELTLPVSGVYRVVARGYSGQVGEYVVELEVSP
jgi:hypothetical protein